MKHCPACSVILIDETYDGVAVWRCRKCHGVLLQKYKLEMIRHRRARDRETLTKEAKAEFSQDTKRQIRCPRCFEHMDKRSLAGKYGNLKFDFCKVCEAVWLDGGELAIAQLAFAASGRGRASLESQQRMREFETDTERKAEFQANLARMPDELPVSIENETLADIEAGLFKSLFRFVFRP
jgi:Zn-finger nucleic acid-binding protein